MDNSPLTNSGFLDDGNGLLGLDLSVLALKDDSKSKVDTSSDTIINLPFGKTSSSIPFEESLDSTLDVNDNNTKVKDATTTTAVKKPAIVDKGEDEDEDEDDEDEEDRRTLGETKLVKSGTSDNPYRLFAEVLKSQGSITDIPETFEETEEGIKKLVDEEVDSRVKIWIDSLPATAKFFVESYKEGTPLNSLLRSEAAIESYKSIDKDTLSENINVQKTIINDYHIKNGWTQEEIREEVEENESSGTLESKAKRYLGKLIQAEENERQSLIEESRESEKRKQATYESKINDIRTSLKNMKEILPGITLNENDKRTIFNGITRFDKEGKNEIMKFRESNPDFDYVTTYLALVLKGNLAHLNRAAITKATNGIKEKVQSGNFNSDREDRLKGVDLTVMKNVLKNPIF